MRVLVTGAGGFIGSHIVTALESAGHDVVALDLFLASAHGDAPDRDGSIRRIDVRNAEDLGGVLDGVDVVCHQAAVVGAGVDVADAPAYASHNDFGTAVLLSAMARVGCQRLVLASSMVVYGDGLYSCTTHGSVEPSPRRRVDLDDGIFDQRCPVCASPVHFELVGEDAPLRPRSLYAASKLAQENYAQAWSLSTGGSVTALRYHNVYGDHMPRDTPYSGVAAMFRSSLEAGAAPTVFEDGGQTRDFIHVRDVAAANVCAIESPLDGFAPLNVCSGHPITILEVASVLAEVRGGLSPVVTGQYRPGDVRHVVADPKRATEQLGFTASVLPTDGLERFAFEPLRRAGGGGPPRV